MIGRTHRFHGRNGLRHVYSRGQTIRGAQMSLKVAPGRAGKGYRVAVVVSKKVHKSAVVRNRIRRRLYEIVRNSNISKIDLDVVITVFSEQLAVIPAEELGQSFENMLKQVKIN